MFLEMAHQILYAPDVEQWRPKVHLFQSHRGTCRVCKLEAEFFSFWKKIPFTAIHFFHSGMPRTNNIIEGMIRNLSRKIDDTDASQSFETACNALKHLMMNYRFHAFSCSRNRAHTGLRPQQLAGGDISNINWVEFSQQRITSN